MWYLPTMAVMRFWSTVFLIVLMMMTSVGAQEEKKLESVGYEVGIGDVIEVTAFQEDEITGEFLVEASGAITFPLLGPVPVAGMTPAAISAVLEELLERDYYVDVQLKVKVETFASQPVTCLLYTSDAADDLLQV